MAERESIVGPSATLVQTGASVNSAFRCSYDPLPATQFADRQSVKKDLPFALADQAKPIAVDPVYAMKLSYVTPPQGVSNNTNFSDPEFDALFNKVLLEQDPQTRQQLLDKMQNILAEKLAMVPILETKLLYATQKNVQGAGPHPSQVLMWRYLHH